MPRTLLHSLSPSTLVFFVARELESLFLFMFRAVVDRSFRPIFILPTFLHLSLSFSASHCWCLSVALSIAVGCSLLLDLYAPLSLVLFATPWCVC